MLAPLSGGGFVSTSTNSTSNTSLSTPSTPIAVKSSPTAHIPISTTANDIFGNTTPPSLQGGGFATPATPVPPITTNTTQDTASSTANASTNANVNANGSTSVPSTTVSCTGGFMDLFTAGCPDPFSMEEILLGIGGLVVVYMMMRSGRR